MDDVLTRIWQNLGDRISGPMSFRLILQPAMATFLAIRAGLQDARTGQPPYFWAIMTADPAHRRQFLQEGWKAVSKVFCLAVVLDVIYQYIVQRWVYPVEALLVAFVLACVPYLLIRGPVNKLMRFTKATPRTENP